MKITPIKNINIYQQNTYSANTNSKASVLKNDKNISFCGKTIVKNTPNKFQEFSNSRNNCLIDIDLADICIPNNDVKLNDICQPTKSKSVVNNTLNTKNISFLADMDLCDAYELPKKKSNVSFTSTYPQFLIDQDAVSETYKTCSDEINNITNTTCCSFGNSDKKETSIVKKIKNILTKYISL